MAFKCTDWTRETRAAVSRGDRRGVLPLVQALLLLQQLHDRVDGAASVLHLEVRRGDLAEQQACRTTHSNILSVTVGCGPLLSVTVLTVELVSQLAEEDGDPRRRLELDPTVDGDRLLGVLHLRLGQ